MRFISTWSHVAFGAETFSLAHGQNTM